MSAQADHEPAGGVIDITDLRAPVLSDLQRQALEGAPEVTLDEEVVLEAARQTTGLSDFGDEDFRLRLRLWMKSADDDRELSRLGRAGVYGLAVRYAANRLRLEALVRRHPEILDIEIDRPLIIAGLPRSGTTHLQNLLAADDRLRSLPYWEAVKPFPGPEDAVAPGQEDPRHTRAAAGWAAADALMPYSKAMHEFSPDHISEDVELQGLDFGSYHLEWLSRVPAWRDHYFATDQTPVYRYLKKCLQALSFLDGTRKRWLLKCPQHMEQLIALNTVFPDATVILTHRDPVASIQSAITGACYSGRIRRTTVRPEEMAGYWIDRYERLLRACVRDHDKLDPEHMVDVYFDRFMAGSMATVEEIYRKADLPLTSDLRQAMTGFIESHGRGRHGQVRYDLRRDFGLTPQEVRARFQFYFDRFPVAVEVK